MKRRLLNLLTALSLLLCVALAALWVWSYRGGGFLLYGGWSDPDGVVQGGYWCAGGQSGKFSLTRVRFQYRPSDDEQLQQLRENLGPQRVRRLSGEPEPAELHHVWDLQYDGWQLLGVGYLAARWGTEGEGLFTDRRLIAPAWLPVAAFSLLPLMRLGSAVRRRRRRAGLCPACGYDLRATPEKCPECGRVPTESAA